MALPLEFGQKNGLNVSEDLFLVLIYDSLELRSFCYGFYLPFQIPGYASSSPPFENPAYATA